MNAVMKVLPFTREPSLLDRVWMALRYPIDLVTSPIKAVLSIPALSFLVIPAFSSYGTSVNLLFFYMTWAILIRSNDPIQVELYGTLGTRVLFYILPSLAFLAFDSIWPSLAMTLKEHGKPALPTSKEQWSRRGLWWKITLFSVANVLLSVALQISLELFVTRVLHLRSLLRLSTGVPLPWSIAKDLFFGFILRESFTYTLHRHVLHSEHSRLTDLHEKWQHSVHVPFSLVAHYDHPLPYLIHSFVPMYLPAILFRFHLLTYQIYLIFVSLEETFAYSGYNLLPSAFILGGIARRHENHFIGNRNGNFGCFGLADMLMGTNLGTDLVDDVIDEVEEEDFERKAIGKSRDLRRRTEKMATRNRIREERERPQRKDSSPLRKASNRRDDEELEEASEGAREETTYGPGRKARKAQRNGKKNSDENEAAEEEAGMKARSVGRRGSQKGRGSNRPRKRNEEE